MEATPAQFQPDEFNSWSSENEVESSNHGGTAKWMNPTSEPWWISDLSSDLISDLIS